MTSSLPIPAYPWSQRPHDCPLTTDEVASALALSGGSIAKAADRLKVGSLVLRKFIAQSPRARSILREYDARLVDTARDKLEEALNSEDDRRADWAIRFVLNSRNARSAGWSSSDPAESSSNHPPQMLVLPVVAWADGTQIGPPPAAKEAAKQLVDAHKADPVTIDAEPNPE